MKTIVCAGLLGVALLSGCSKPAAGSYSDGAVAPAAPQQVIGGTDPADAAKAPADPLRVPQLAYDYTYRFSASAENVEALRKADQAACEQAGPQDCQMISLSADSDKDNDTVNKTLELRVTPAWLKRWQAGLDASVARAHGRIAQQNVTSEDLSLQIVDTTAHIRNKEALRDNLQTIVRTSKGKISELVDAETQLSNVQADIDTAQSQLAVMQKRVATTHLTLTYQSNAVAASTGTFAPVADAFGNILRNMMLMVSVLINVLSFLIPLAVVAVPVVWAVMKWRANRKPKAPAPGPGEPPPSADA